MRFDNKDFEKNVQTTMSTLDKFKQKLNFNGASKGLENIEKSASKVNMSGLGSAVETVQAKFSKLEVMSVTALANITNSAVNAGKRIVDALTLEPVMSGFQEYETQINAVQTILANTSSKGSTLEDVNKALDELNHYADMTIYNFTEMTKNIGTFTAAGVDLDASVSAIKGIANLAAVSGSTSQQASTAMYQLSQALAAGTVKLQDWNSVVNAGMGGQVFQDALKETAKVHGVAIDKMIKDEGSFRETLKKGWLTSDILTETLSKFTGDLNEQQLKTMGYSEEQIKSIIKMGKTANDAATKVKTFSQLFDTLKEAAQSGWTQSWEIIVGDFEEAKSFLTGISDTLSNMINTSADARNKVLSDWKDLGGRTAIIDSLKNTFEGLESILKPIHEAFKDIFPPITAKQLYSFSVGLKKLTSHLKISDTTANNLKETFKGVFSLFDIGISAITSFGKGIISVLGSFAGIEGGVLGVTAELGKGVTGFRNYIKEIGLFENITGGLSNILISFINGIKTFSKAILDQFNVKDFSNIFESIANIVSGGIKNISDIMQNLIKTFSSSDLIDVLNNGILATILLKIKKTIGDLSSSFESGSGVIKNITGILDDVRDCFKAYQKQLKAGTLIKIAVAIGILAGAIFTLSTIKADALTSSLVALTVLFVELVQALNKISDIQGNISNTIKACSLMIAMSISIGILANALKNIASIDWGGLSRGLVGIGALMTELSLFISKTDLTGKIRSSATGLVLIATAMLILSKAIEEFSCMNWEDIGKGVAAIGGLLTLMSVFTNTTKSVSNAISIGVAINLLATSINNIVDAMKNISDMSLDDIQKGLIGIGGALGSIALGMNLMPKNMLTVSAGLLIVCSALENLSSFVTSIGESSWNDLAKGLSTLGASLGILSVGLKAMQGSIGGSVALISASVALLAITNVIKELGSVNIASILKSLVTIASVFAIIGAASTILSPLIPIILSLAVAFTLFGAAILSIGAGLTLMGVGLTTISAGITALALSAASGATSIVASLTIIITGFISLIPTIIAKMAEGIVSFVQVISESASKIATALMKVLAETLKSLSTYGPVIVDSLLSLFVKIIDSVAEHVPELIVAFNNLFRSIFDGVINSLKNVNSDSLLKVVSAVGIMTVLMKALSTVTSVLPSAMVGLAGIGVAFTELSGILALLGGLAQIPGLKWLIGEGGVLLETIGTAIGKFIGGIAGGISAGVTSSLPVIGTNLSAFMKNLEPFINSIGKINGSIFSNVKELSKSILLLTGTSFIQSLTSCVGGRQSFKNFGEQLEILGNSLEKFSEKSTEIASEDVLNSTKAIKIIIELMKSLPKTGGLSQAFGGTKDLGDFSSKLGSFGDAVKKYADNVSDIEPEKITSSATAIKAISDLLKNITNIENVDSGTLGSKFKNIGDGIKQYSEAVSGVNSDNVTNSLSAAKSLVEIVKSIYGTGSLFNSFVSLNLSAFGDRLAQLGNALSKYSNSIGTINTSTIQSSALAVKNLLQALSTINTGNIVGILGTGVNFSALGTNLSNLGSAITKYSTSIQNATFDKITSSTSAIKSLLGVISAVYSSGALFNSNLNIPNDLGEKLVIIGNAMTKYSASINSVNAGSIINSSNAIKALMGVIGSINITSTSVGLLNSVGSSDFTTKITSLGTCLNNYSKSIGNINANGIIKSTTALKSLVIAINSMTGINSMGVSTFVQAINTIGQANIGEFVKNLSGSSEKMKSAGVNLIEALKKGIESKSKSISSTATSIANSMSKTFTSKSSSFSKAGSTAANGMLKALKSKKGDFKEVGGNFASQLSKGFKSDKINSKCEKICKAAVKKLNEYKDDFYNAGKNLVLGFANGITDNTFMAEARAAAMAQASLAKAKKTLDEHSPSKEFYKIGKFAVLGFVNSFSDNMKLVNKSGSNLARQSMDGMGKAMNQIGDVIMNGIDPNPTIRPVVDLSNIQNGVGAINGMFNDTALGNLGGISASINRKIQNGSNANVIDAIKDLKRAVSNMSGDNYSINGVTYDDGSNIADAIRTIAHAAKIERRS
ncbi:tape measure protein [Anaerostipes hadrus]|uniref:tape measure protein n=1 Tax=Anaerostipes hadrus TaxID=649756 RepID=UPI001AD7F8B7|nr:tape measure protein [Anaerostipes hadrus]